MVTATWMTVVTPEFGLLSEPFWLNGLYQKRHGDAEGAVSQRTKDWLSTGLLRQTALGVAQSAQSRSAALGGSLV